jgi:hypothetical protein
VSVKQECPGPKADTTANVYMQTIEEGVKLPLDAILRGADGDAKVGGGSVKGRNLVRFGTVGFCTSSASDCTARTGRLTQR